MKKVREKEKQNKEREESRESKGRIENGARRGAEIREREQGESHAQRREKRKGKMQRELREKTRVRARRINTRTSWQDNLNGVAGVGRANETKKGRLLDCAQRTMQLNQRPRCANTWPRYHILAAAQRSVTMSRRERQRLQISLGRGSP